MFDLLELLFVLGAELFTDAAIRAATGAPSDRGPMHPVAATICFGLMGAGLGAATTIFFRESFIHAGWLRVVNLVCTPILAGLIMAGIGALLRLREKKPIRLESFTCGFALAFGLNLVRFLVTT